ncbi:molybdopterin-dependent oxidoreductase [Arachidicoccus ginsenosidivorans]|nr:molybdopterin-dependent oxidoreductase [Arachidicoccus ginsenosidivorans]
MMKLRYITLPLILLFFGLGQSNALSAQNNTTTNIALQIKGEVLTPLNLTIKQLKEYPTHQVDVKDKNGKSHRYTGVYVQDVLTKAGVTTGHDLKGENLTKYVLADCADGYQVLYSLAELDSSFTAHPPIIAYQMDGQPLFQSKGPLRMVMPQDKKPARDCFQLKSLSVHFAKE